MTTAVILQPSYVPWRGFFDLVRRADVFVFYDDVQYDKHGWRNRNRIKTAHGTKWISIPVAARGNVSDKLLVKDAPIVWRDDWAKKHLATIRQSYAKAPCFAAYAPLVDEIYGRASRDRPPLLCDFTIAATKAIAAALGVSETRFVRSSELGIEGGKTERLVSIVKGVGADHYLSGPAAKDYLEEHRFRDAGVTLEYAAYDYPEYEQLHPPYDPQVSVLDLLFMKGPRAAECIWR